MGINVRDIIGDIFYAMGISQRNAMYSIYTDIENVTGPLLSNDTFISAPN